MIFSVITVTWNSERFIKNCIISLVKNIQYPFELILIDNGSSDATCRIISEIQNTSPYKIHLVKNTENLGFARATNIGIKLSQGRYIVLLNPDTLVFPDTFSEILKFFQSHPSCAIMGGRHLNPDGTTQPSVRRLPMLLDQILILLKIHRIFPNLLPLKKYLQKDFNYKLAQRAEQPAGSFLAVPKEVLNTLGFWDENFSIWFEDVDFCARAKLKGWEIYYNPKSVIVHFGGGSFSQADIFSKQQLYGKSLLKYFSLHHSKIERVILSIFFAVSLAQSYILSLFQKPKIPKIKIE